MHAYMHICVHMHMCMHMCMCMHMSHVHVHAHVQHAHAHVPWLHPQVLCAFELLLREAGGVLSDVYGEPIDLLSEVGTHLSDRLAN